MVRWRRTSIKAAYNQRGRLPTRKDDQSSYIEERVTKSGTHQEAKDDFMETSTLCLGTTQLQVKWGLAIQRCVQNDGDVIEWKKVV